MIITFDYFFVWQIDLDLIKIIQSVSNLILQSFSYMSTEKTFHYLVEPSMSSNIRAVNIAERPSFATSLTPTKPRLEQSQHTT